MRVVLSLLIAILAFGSFGFQAQASGPIPGEENCLPGATVHSIYNCKWNTIGNQPAFLGFDDQEGKVYYARIASSALPGLTPLYNTIEVVSETMSLDPSKSTQQVVGRLVLKYQFSPRLHTIATVGNFVLVLGEINPDRDGYLLIDVSDLEHPKQAGGGVAGSNWKVGEWSYISSFLVLPDRVIMAVNHDSTLLGASLISQAHRGEVVTYLVSSNGGMTKSRIFETSDRVDYIDQIWVTEDFVLLTTDRLSRSHRVYLTPTLELIGTR